MTNKAEWENWANLVLGIWLFFSPWIFLENLNVVAMSVNINFWLAGILIAISAGVALQQLKPWEEWVNLILGVWVILSPWIMGFAAQKYLVWNSIVVGLAIAVLSGIALPVAQKLQRQEH